MEKQFYEKCAEVLGTTYDCESFEYRKRTRWNNRKPGNGRFPGYGLIRKFGSKIQVALHHPVQHHGIYNSEQEVVDFLHSVCDR